MTHAKYQIPNDTCHGGIAQLGERLLCKQEVIGSIPFASTLKSADHARNYRGVEQPGSSSGS